MSRKLTALRPLGRPGRRTIGMTKVVRPVLKVLGVLLALGCAVGSAPADDVRAGEGSADITPPVGTEMAGFHTSPGGERRSTGVRQPSSARVHILSTPDGEFALVSLDVCAISQEIARTVKAEVAREASLKPENVHLCATHTHTGPTLRYHRQWGGLPSDYAALVSKRVVEAAVAARRDLAPARFLLGKERVLSGNFNRTTGTWKTEDAFGKEASEQERWLDRMLHAMVFTRGEGRRTLVWYQFSAHAVCYKDPMTGPDWPGLVAEALRSSDGLAPSFLQGHCGDVNPGSGTPWLGDPKQTSEAIATALRQAIRTARPVPLGVVRHVTGEFAAPLRYFSRSGSSSRSTAAIRRKARRGNGSTPASPTRGLKSPRPGTPRGATISRRCRRCASGRSRSSSTPGSSTAITA